MFNALDDVYFKSIRIDPTVFARLREVWNRDDNVVEAGPCDNLYRLVLGGLAQVRTRNDALEHRLAPRAVDLLLPITKALAVDPKEVSRQFRKRDRSVPACRCIE
jgi:hypothetical protein